MSTAAAAAPAQAPAAAPVADSFGVAASPLDGWRCVFEGPDPSAAFWDETSDCLQQFADMFDIADKDAEE